jgi:hypothetical protein
MSVTKCKLSSDSSKASGSFLIQKRQGLNPNKSVDSLCQDSTTNENTHINKAKKIVLNRLQGLDQK